MFGQILGAVAGPLVGGLLDRGKKQQYHSPHDNILSHAKGARAAAEKYGFNPLTLLQSGLGGGGVTSGTAPALSSGAYISEAISRGVDTYFNVKQERADQEAEAIRSATQHMENVRGQQARNPLQRFGYGLTDVAPFGGINVRNGGVVDPYPEADTDLAVPDPLLNRGAGWFGGGEYLAPTPGWSPAEVIENEYGDLAGTVYGPVKIARDAIYNAPRLWGGHAGDFLEQSREGLTKWRKSWDPTLDMPDSLFKPPMFPDYVKRNSNYYTTRHAGPLAAFR